MKNNGCNCKDDINENIKNDKMSEGDNGMGGMMPPMAKMMMNKMMGKMKDEKFNPMEMCKTMGESITTTAKIAGLATPEVQALFEDWASEVEKEILNVIKEEGQINPLAIAEKLKITEDSALYFVSKLVRDKKIKVNVELAESTSNSETASSDAEAEDACLHGNCNIEGK